MVIYENLALIERYGYQIDIIWGMFLSLHVGIFAGLVNLNKRANEKILSVRVSSALLYMLFSVVNCRGLIDDYEIMQLLIDFLVKSNNQESLGVLYYFYKGISYYDRWYLVVFIHVIALFFILFNLFVCVFNTNKNVFCVKCGGSDE